MTNEITLHKAKEQTLENLESIQASLVRCVAEGMADPNDVYYNDLLALIDDAHIVKNWDELEELIIRAKTLEMDIASWLSLHGRTSVSLPWPKTKF